MNPILNNFKNLQLQMIKKGVLNPNKINHSKYDIFSNEQIQTYVKGVITKNKGIALEIQKSVISNVKSELNCLLPINIRHNGKIKRFYISKAGKCVELLKSVEPVNKKEKYFKDNNEEEIISYISNNAKVDDDSLINQFGKEVVDILNSLEEEGKIDVDDKGYYYIKDSEEEEDDSEDEDDSEEDNDDSEDDDNDSEDEDDSEEEEDDSEDDSEDDNEDDFEDDENDSEDKDDSEEEENDSEEEENDSEEEENDSEEEEDDSEDEDDSENDDNDSEDEDDSEEEDDDSEAEEDDDSEAEEDDSEDNNSEEDDDSEAEEDDSEEDNEDSEDNNSEEEDDDFKMNNKNNEEDFDKKNKNNLSPEELEEFAKKTATITLLKFYKTSNDDNLKEIAAIELKKRGVDIKDNEDNDIQENGDNKLPENKAALDELEKFTKNYLGKYDDEDLISVVVELANQDPAKRKELKDLYRSYYSMNNNGNKLLKVDEEDFKNFLTDHYFNNFTSGDLQSYAYLLISKNPKEYRKYKKMMDLENKPIV